MCASRRPTAPTANKRKMIMLRMGWCHKHGQNPALDEGEASSRSRAAWQSKSEAEIAVHTRQNSLQMPVRIYQGNYCLYNGDVATARAMRRYGKSLGVRHAEARRGCARGPPMAVTEAGTQYLAILSQHHSCSALSLTGAFFRNTPPLRLSCSMAIAGLSGNMLLCFVPHVHWQPGTRIAYWVTSYLCGSTVTLVYHCILVWVLYMSSVKLGVRVKKKIRGPERVNQLRGEEYSTLAGQGTDCAAEAKAPPIHILAALSMFIPYAVLDVLHLALTRLDDIIKTTFSPMGSISSFFYDILWLSRKATTSPCPPTREQRARPAFYPSLPLIMELWASK
ncbi:hypothetical protein F5888DRAFT_1636213 [Russula emetica]|nr:hypothetical protein F5888DRAFT_1636213 [Russula emetica]